MGHKDNESFFLPDELPHQTYVSVAALVGGSITLPDRFFVEPADEESKRTVPSLSFLITHPGPSQPVFGCSTSKPYQLLFDLGLRSRIERYGAPLQKHLDGRKPYQLAPGVAEQLTAGGTNPANIDAVMLSHVHYDHHGDPEDFPNSTFILGHGAQSVLKNGLTGKGAHQHFEPSLLAQHKVIELPPAEPSRTDSTNPSLDHTTSDEQNLQWKPLGPFPATLDLFSDASVYIIDTPGHLPGHINLLCRIGPRKWICLCGDAFHDRRLLTGEKEIGTWSDGVGGRLCIHLDKAGAEESIRRLRRLGSALGGEIELVAAHDEEWVERHREKMFPSTL